MICGFCDSGITAQDKFKKLKDGTIKKYIYYARTRARDLHCKNRCIHEEELVKLLIELISRIDMDASDIKKKFDGELKRVSKFHKTFLGIKQANPIAKEFNVKDYVAYVLQEGTIEEKRELLACLKSKLVLKNRIITLN